MRHPALILLSHDHHQALALALRCRKQALGQMKPMGHRGLKERAKELEDFFAEHLERHFRAEEEILFPIILSRASQSVPLIDDLLKDHKQLRQGVASLEARESLSKILFDLGDLLERHIRREERELFPLFEKHATDADANSVKREIEKIYPGDYRFREDRGDRR